MFAFVCFVLAAGSVASPVVADAKDSVVVVVDGQEVVVDAAALAALPQADVTGTDKDGSAHSWRGVVVSALLATRGVLVGEQLRGPALKNVVVVEASDGYAVSFGVADLDAVVSGRTAILAKSKDGKALDVAHGPLQLIVSDDKKPTRWVRQVVRLRVIAP